MKKNILLSLFLVGSVYGANVTSQWTMAQHDVGITNANNAAAWIAANSNLVNNAVQTTSTNNIVLEHGDGGYATLTLGITSELESGLGNVVISAPNGTARVYGQTGVEIDAQGGTATLYGSLNVTNDITVGGDANFTGGPLTIPDGSLDVHALNMQTADSFYLYATGTTNKTLIDAAISASSGGSADIDLYLPEKIYAVEGTECNVYFDNIIYGEYQDYYWEVDSTEGVSKQLIDCWRFTPTSAEVGTDTLYLSAYDKNSGSIIGAATSTVYTAVLESGALATNQVETVTGSSYGGLSSQSAWGMLYAITNAFDRVRVPQMLVATNCDFIVAEVRQVTLTADAGNQTDILNAPIISAVTNAVDVANRSTTAHAFTFDFASQIAPASPGDPYFIGITAYQTNLTSLAAMGACNRVPSNAHTNLQSHYKTTGTDEWLPRAGDTLTGLEQYEITLSGVSNATVLCIGDSTGYLTDRWIDQLHNLDLSDSYLDLDFIGTRTNATVLNEAVTGKTWAWHYSDADSAFTFGSTFDFDTYISTNSFATPDYVLTHLGLNDVQAAGIGDSNVAARAASDIAIIDAMIASVSNHSASVKFCIGLTIPPSGTQYPFGLTYKTGKSRWEFKRRVVLYNSLIEDEYQNRTGENIYVIPVNTAYDTINNQQLYTYALNSHNSTTVSRGYNGLHPATSGYQQMADAFYAFLKNQ